MDKYYNLLFISFTVILIGSNIAAIKIWHFFGYIFDGGTPIFPLLYVLGDITSEVYGFKATRKIIRTALFVNILFSLFLYVITLLPYREEIPANCQSQNAAFNTIFSISPRIFIASIISYYIGEILNSYILTSLKVKLGSKFFVPRAIISTFIGASLESLIFCSISFIGILDYNNILELAFIHSLIKTFYEILAMPITVSLVKFFNKVRVNDTKDK